MPARVATLVNDLPEVYQPIFGHPEFDARAQRHSRDRLAPIADVADAMSRALGRKLRILDIGCAQGFFSLSLAARGHEVTGIDVEPRNLALCRRLAAEQTLAARFELAPLDESFLARFDDGAFDLAIACSVLHHLCHSLGAPRTTRIARRLVQRAHVLVAELARRDEPLYWATSLPERPEALLEDIAFVRELGRFPTHLSGHERPLLLASDRFAYAGGDMRAIARAFRSPHEFERGVHLGTRRYFLTADHWLVKTVRFEGPHAQASRRECEAEVAFLEAASPRLDFLPRPMHSESAPGWFVSERPAVPGVRLSTLLARGIAFDAGRVLEEVLAELAALEADGWCHRDLRSWNVIIAEDGRAHLIDFGQVSREERTDVMGMLSAVDAFWSLAYEALHATPNPRPLPLPRFDPDEFPEPWRSALARSREPGPGDSFAGIASALAASRASAPVTDAAARRVRSAAAGAYAEFSRRILEIVP